ncbi:MAG: PilZ domain-containing protein [Lachnospiraceae bacterium]|nr:PilZ domain-containing protein [Lachnospiraceae bacterium]
MAGSLRIKTGTKLQMAVDVAVGEEPNFNMICTFNKSLDESAFLISIPMQNGQPLQVDESQKLLIRYGSGNDAMILAGYVDDIVKDGIRRYWKVRRVSEQRQFLQRVDERLKVTLRVEYKQETWAVNADGVIEKEDGMSLDISAGGAAIYLNRHFDVGEICELTLPRIGTTDKGRAMEDLVGTVCWMREAPKGSLYKHLCGLQFRFSDPSERQRLQEYIQNVKEKYRL